MALASIKWRSSAISSATDESRIIVANNGESDGLHVGERIMPVADLIMQAVCAFIGR